MKKQSITVFSITQSARRDDSVDIVLDIEGFGNYSSVGSGGQLLLTSGRLKSWSKMDDNIVLGNNISNIYQSENITIEVYTHLVAEFIDTLPQVVDALIITERKLDEKVTKHLQQIEINDAKRRAVVEDLQQFVGVQATETKPMRKITIDIYVADDEDYEVIINSK